MIKVKYLIEGSLADTLSPQEKETLNQFQTLDREIRKKYNTRSVLLILAFDTESDARNYIAERSAAAANTGYTSFIASRPSSNSTYSVIITDEQDNVIEVVH